MDEEDTAYMKWKIREEYDPGSWKLACKRQNIW